MSGFEIKAPPVIHPDDCGGIRLRVSVDGKPYWHQLSQATCLQMMVQMSLHLKKCEAERRAGRPRLVREPMA